MSIVITVSVPTVVEVARSTNEITPTLAPRTVTLNRSETALVVDPAPRTVDINRITHPVTVHTGGTQGIPGEADGATFTAEAGSIIHGGRVVRIANGLVYHPDTSVTVHADQTIGIAVNSAVLGADVLVRVAGAYVEPGASYTPGPMFCDNDGVLTQSIPPTGWLMIVGRGIDATSFDVDIELAFHRA